jgi:hypothetical protein
VDVDDVRRPGWTLTPMAQETVERLWRLRKHGHSAEAQLRPTSDGGAEIRFFYDGAMTYERAWQDKDDAIDEALRKRTELERSGWIAHW